MFRVQGLRFRARAKPGKTCGKVGVKRIKIKKEDKNLGGKLVEQ